MGALGFVVLAIAIHNLTNLTFQIWTGFSLSLSLSLSRAVLVLGFLYISFSFLNVLKIEILTLCIQRKWASLPSFQLDYLELIAN